VWVEDGGVVCRDAEVELACLDAAAQLFATVAEETVQVFRVDSRARVAVFRLE
jgi:hypothetical protein